ncbi:MAG: cupin domain-containing protein [Actinomycetota bacterium]|nr:cupin domain-containing protein [Actinomycetota bacterium]
MESTAVKYDKQFKVLLGNSRAQAAEMVIAPGNSEGGPENRHENSDQWLYVASGEGEAVVNGEKVQLKTGSLVLIEKGARHEIKNTGGETLRTLNFYVPPEY